VVVALSTEQLQEEGLLESLATQYSNGADDADGAHRQKQKQSNQQDDEFGDGGIDDDALLSLHIPLPP
jgi:hypothetical protein